MNVVLTIPGVRIENPLNGTLGRHWRTVHNRGVAEKDATRLALAQLGRDVRDALRAAPAVRVRLVRLCKRQFDDDGLAAGFKYVRDVLADWLRPGLAVGRADAKKYGLRFDYDQDATGVYGVRIEMTTEGE